MPEFILERISVDKCIYIPLSLNLSGILSSPSPTIYVHHIACSMAVNASLPGVSVEIVDISGEAYKEHRNPKGEDKPASATPFNDT